jgi:uncharacterized protein YciW
MTAPDAIDEAAGLTPADPLFTARRLRPEFVDGAEACRASVLTPRDGLGLSRGLRAALARRMAELNGDKPLMQQYDQALAASDPTADESRLARGDSDLPEPLASIARHADLITCDPTRATGDDIARLAAAGLDNPRIVALSELIAFVNFQTRVAMGLRLMRRP